MTDPTELIARLENGFFYTEGGEASDVPDQAAAMLRILAAERDAAITNLVKEETSHGETINDRDRAEEALSQAYFLIIGESPQWSNLFGHKEALDEIYAAQRSLRLAARAVP